MPGLDPIIQRFLGPGRARWRFVRGLIQSRGHQADHAREARDERDEAESGQAEARGGRVAPLGRRHRQPRPHRPAGPDRPRGGLARGRARADRLRPHPRPDPGLRPLGHDLDGARQRRSPTAPIYRTLDLGAQGICVPHIDTGEAARKFVEAAKFAPLGKRGLFTSRQGYGVPDYLERANDHTLLIALIEDVRASRTWTRSWRSTTSTSSSSHPRTSRPRWA